MNKLLNRIKKILNKDVTAFLNKNKIPLISIVIVVLLSCVGLIITYAFYQVVDVKPIIGGATSEISDLDIRIMAEERDANGNGLNKYGLYPYIPKAGYVYNETKSKCTNGSTIKYDSTNYSADVTALGHDVCYLYFDSIAQLDITLNVYAENVDSDGNGNGEYTKLETTALPTIGYEINDSKSKCQNGSTVTYSAADNLFSVESNQKDVCDVYMDAMDVDIALKIYVQAKKNSTTYYEAKTIPSNSFYELSSKSACTGTSTLSMKNQKVVVAATGRTSCVAYLDVSSGPILESMKVTSGTTGTTITLGNSPLGLTPNTYYYSSDGGKTYVSSTNNSYTFAGLTNPSYAFRAYSADASGNTSRVFETSTYGYYGLVDYSNQIQTKTITEPGYYKLETWGAQGGNIGTYIGGYGGYSTGYIYLSGNQQLNIAVGGAGTNTDTGGYNGGGSLLNGQSAYGSSGGGATHIATISGVLSSLENNKDNILIVSGGGGGANYRSENYGEGNGGSAGGFIGVNGESTNHSNGYGYGYGYGGSQTAGGTMFWESSIENNNIIPGAFGQGSGTELGCFAQSGGGGGYYGGGAGGHGGAGGGSSYIGNPLLTNKSMYCYNCTTSSEESTKTFTTTCHSANATENCAKEGNGYAIITYIGSTI